MIPFSKRKLVTYPLLLKIADDLGQPQKSSSLRKPTDSVFAY